jgi:DNA-binding transcriptional ArsR family regulator
MSIHISSVVWRTALGGPSIKAVAMKLADCAHDDGTSAYPSVRTIARETEVSERTVQSALKELLALGVIVKARDGGSGPGNTTVYHFDLETLYRLHAETQTKWKSEDVGKGANSAPLKPAKGANSAPKGANSAKKGATTAPKPSLTINNHQTPPGPQVGVQEGSKSDLKSGRKAVRAFILTPSDHQWKYWLAAFPDLKKGEEPVAIEVYSSKWPDTESRAPRVLRTRGGRS